MAEKTMHHAVIGADTFELVDQSARADVSDLKNALTAVEIVDSASGTIASFADGSDSLPVKRLTVQMEPIQAGSGDPSPDNVRPISGRTGVTVFHSGSDTSDPTTISVNWETEAGTVYGGTLDVTQGVLTVDRSMVDLGTLTWTMNISGQFYATLPQESVVDRTGATVVCSMYKSDNAYAGTDKAVCVAGNSYRVWARDTNYSDAVTFKTAMSGVQLVYELAQPVTVQLTAQQMTTLLGQNNVWSDADSVSVDYVADTKLYIARVIADALS